MSKKLNNLFLLTFFALLSTTIACNTSNEKLPILGRREAVKKVVNGKEVIDTVYQSIQSFRFVNQDSQWVSNDTFKDKIYVADFFFTSCPTICPIMKKNMLVVYNKLKGNPHFGIISHSIDPRHDSVSVLKKFAHKLGVDDTQWNFVTGNRDSIYALAENSYLTVAKEDQNAPGGIVHQGAFILIDKNRHIRGVYNGTNTDEVEKMILDIENLLNEDEKK
ncbi:SCO family protein [Solitalea sp. MAHUQ-68]|uniref:SCO family protein n=1 Tax=Solitalea agri TaxID=2953739 RepID=A0A9X2EZA8_9SPHI|nr:SCO family protein [Solitalea agri]MCO4291321.1 SCO family protein [Solitalea agri]